MGFEDGSYVGFDMTQLYHNYSVVSELVDGGENSTCPDQNVTSWCYSNRAMNMSSNVLGPIFNAGGPYDCRVRPWYLRGMQASDTGAWSPIYTYNIDGTGTDMLGFDAVRPIYDNRRNKIGVADISITLTNLNKELQLIVADAPDVFAFVVNGNFSSGTLVATTDANVPIHTNGVLIVATESNDTRVRTFAEFFGELDGTYGNQSQVYTVSTDDGDDYWAEAAEYSDEYGLRW